MKQIIAAFAVVMVLIQVVQAEDKIVEQSKLPELKKMNAVLQDPVLTIAGAIEKPDSYVLKLVAKSPQGSQMMMGYLMKATSELYLGQGYIKDGHPIVFPRDTDAIKNGVAFTYGTGSKEIYLVTDPECPYCTKFAKNATGKMADYKVHVIFFPLSFHKKSPAMIEWILQGKDDAEKKKRYDEVMLKNSQAYAALAKTGSVFSYSPAVQEKIDQAGKATMELNVRGTPMLFDAEFKPLSMEQILGKMPKATK